MSLFVELNLVGFIAQLYSAGYESTANILAWALLFMCLHVDIQKKVQAEIDEAIGKSVHSLKIIELMGIINNKMFILISIFFFYSTKSLYIRSY